MRTGAGLPPRRPPLAVPPALVALAAAVYLVLFGVRRARQNGGPPTFG